MPIEVSDDSYIFTIQPYLFQAFNEISMFYTIKSFSIVDETYIHLLHNIQGAKSSTAGMFVFSVILYGSETWTLSKALMDRIEACEMYGKNQLQTENKKWRFAKEIENREKTSKHNKTKFFGHTKRHDSIMKNILEGKMEGRRPWGRPPPQCNNIKEWFGYNSA